MKLRALVIDDSRTMRTMVMDAVRRAKLADFEFIEAEDGADGYLKFSTNPVDIIFVDWDMPYMTGIDFVRKVRSLKRTSIPIIMITGEKRVENVKAAVSAQVTAFLCKPFTERDLAQKLSGILDSIKKECEPSPGHISNLVKEGG